VESSQGRSECPDVGVRFYSRSPQAASLLLHADWLNGLNVCDSPAPLHCSSKVQYRGFIDAAAILVRGAFATVTSDGFEVSDRTFKSQYDTKTHCPEREGAV